MTRLRALLEPVPHGGCFVAVPEDVAAAAGLRYADRVRGTVNGVPYRSALVKYSGVFHLGLPGAALDEAGAEEGDEVDVTLALDDEPLPTDAVPADLAAALDGAPGARAAFERLSPAHRRMQVKLVGEARQAETRARRMARVVEAVLAGTWVGAPAPEPGGPAGRRARSRKQSPATRSRSARRRRG